MNRSWIGHADRSCGTAIGHADRSRRAWTSVVKGPLISMTDQAMTDRSSVMKRPELGKHLVRVQDHDRMTDFPTYRPTRTHTHTRKAPNLEKPVIGHDLAPTALILA